MHKLKKYLKSIQNMMNLNLLLNKLLFLKKLNIKDIKLLVLNKFLIVIYILILFMFRMERTTVKHLIS